METAHLAGLEYHGVSGSTHDCENAVVRLIQSRDHITKARILSCQNEHTADHAVLLTTEIGDHILIKAGFSTGYSGAGPRGFSFVLQLLETHGVEIDECDVPEDLLQRSHMSALTSSGLDLVLTADAVRPTRWHGYVFEDDFERGRNGSIWRDLPPVMPLALIDERLADLALTFWAQPDDNLRKGYARLEDVVRVRTGLTGHGQSLFADAFVKEKAPLKWDHPDRSESVGRGNLFTGAVMAHRNPRAHRELNTDAVEALSEFLLLNHLFRLEAEAIDA